MTTIDRQKLVDELIKAYSEYLKGKPNEKLKQHMQYLYFEFFGAAPLLEDEINHAISGLIGLGADLDSRLSAEEIREILRKLETMKQKIAATTAMKSVRKKN